MLRYMHADMRRFTRQKSRFIYILLILLFIVLMTFCAKNFKWGDSLFNTIFSFSLGAFPMLVGPTIFIALFSDDFRYKSTQQVIGHGLSRTKYVVSKFIECVLITVFYMLLIIGTYLIATKIFNVVYDQSELNNILSGALTNTLQTIGYIAMAMILVFAWQNITMGLWIYFALASGVVSTAITILLTMDMVPKFLSNLSKYLFTDMINAFVTALSEGHFNFIIIPAILGYIILPVIITCILFKNVELDF
ncbi:MAG: hypothetical protein J6P61_06305 [Erysipelotrichaceae bacterium]|nr:hypothetical protein [Erysipelotrichaceae bacterium]